MRKVTASGSKADGTAAPALTARKASSRKAFGKGKRTLALTPFNRAISIDTHRSMPRL